MKVSRLLISGFMLAGLLRAQSEKDMIRELQRDVAQLQNNIRQNKEAQDQKIADLEALLKQSQEANAKLVAEMGSLQQSLTATLGEQQGKLVQPVNLVSNKVDQLSQSVSTLQATADAILQRLDKYDSKLAEILGNLKTLNAPPPAPPPSAVPNGASSASPGASADVAFQAAERDFRGGQNRLAMDEFVSFIAQFPTSESAPKAQYYMGVIYDRDEDYENSVKAYDAVLERYPENPSTRDALYGKAVALMKLDRNVEAKKEFGEFLKKYSTDDKASQVKQYLRDLAGPARPAVRGRKGK